MTHSPYIIGIAGPAGSGKSTLARRLAIALAADGYTTAVHSFAAPIKRMLEAMGVPSRYLMVDKSEPIPGFGLTGRRLMQTLGTEWGRTLDHEIWVNAWLRSMPLAHVVIADDVRFANEAAAIRERGGFVVHLQGILPTSSHASERGVEFRDGDLHADREWPDAILKRITSDLNERNLHGSFRDAIDALRADYLANRLDGETAVEYNERTGKNTGYLRR